MTVIITGIAGFIGSNIARRMTDEGVRGIIGIDRMDNSKVKNLHGIDLVDFIDFDDDRRIERLLSSLEPGSIVLHQGACTDTMETDNRKMMVLNFEKSRRWYSICMEYGHRFIYASSAAVYGYSQSILGNERPLNLYGFSKLLFDQHVLHTMLKVGYQQVVGLRYFNVYGPGEGHKGTMASCVYKFSQQAAAGSIQLFKGSDAYMRDFIHVDDVVDVVLFFVKNPKRSGIFNCGTGVSRSFLELAHEVQKQRPCQLEFVCMPEELQAGYQPFTCSDNTTLHAAGYDRQFIQLEEGVAREVEPCP